MKKLHIKFDKYLIKYLKNFIACSVALIIAAQVTSIFWNPVYGTSDDWIIDSWLNSNQTGMYEKDSVFISSIFSNFISYLYSWNLGFAWYSIILLVICSFSLIHWFTVFSLGKLFTRNKLEYLINTTILVLFFLWNYYSITFTATAIVAAAVGIYSLLKSVTSNDLKRLNFVTGNLLVLSAYVLRPESLIGVTAVFATIALVIFYTKRKESKTFINKTIVTIILLSSFISVNKNIENDQSAEMKEFRSWVMKIQKFADRPRMFEIADNLDASKWSVNQFHLFSDMLYFDKGVFDEEWIDRGLEATNDYYLTPKINFGNLVSLISKYLESTKVLILMFVFSTLFYIRLYWKKSSQTQKYSTVFSLISFAAIHAFVGLFMHNVPRVTTPLLFALFLAISTNWWNIEKTGKDSKIKSDYLYTASIIIGLSLSVFQLHSYNVKNNQRIDLARETTKFIEKNLGDKIILYPGRQEFDKYRNPFIHLNKDPLANSVMFGNWDTFSPQWNKRLENLGFNSKDISNTLLNDNRVLWATQAYPEATVHILEFFKENSFGKFQFNLLAELPNEAKLRYLSRIEN